MTIVYIMTDLIASCIGWYLFEDLLDFIIHDYVYFIVDNEIRTWISFATCM